MPEKFNVLAIFFDFEAKAKNLLTCSIKKVQCDGGLKFKPLQAQFSVNFFSILMPSYTRTKWIS
jgi:hypothetical protein